MAIARAMANNPDILFLDEPTGDLDQYNSAMILKLLISLNQERRMTIVMVTHDIPIKFFSDKVIWIVDGKVNRSEIGSESKKLVALKSLEDTLSAFNAKKQEYKEGVDPIEQRTSAHLIVRKPQDYKTHPDCISPSIFQK